MAILGAGLTHNGRLAANSTLTVTPWPGGSATFNYPGAPAAVVVTTQTKFGPFAQDMPYRLDATTMGLDYFANRAEAPQVPPLFVVSAAAPSNADGRPDGTVYIQTAA